MIARELILDAGEMLIGGFEGTTLPAGASEALSTGSLGGVILFRRNIESVEALVSLNEAVMAAAQVSAPWICIDQEGGPVRRLTEEHGATPVPAMRAVGDVGDIELAAQVGEVLGREVAALGFNVDFAPVVDIDTTEGSFIGQRSFGKDPSHVATMAVAVARGLANAGVVGCAKHFPGHGDTRVDSHLDLPVLPHDMARLESVELVPFRRLVASGIPMIMTAHILLPELDPDHPATLSPAILQGLLRERLGFQGLIVSDDLEMKAVADRYGLEDAIRLGLRAGVDVFLVCRQPALWQRAHQILVELALASPSDRARVATAAARVREAKARHLPPVLSVQRAWREVLGCADHQAVISALRRA